MYSLRMLDTQYELPFLAVFLYAIGNMLSWGTGLEAFGFLCYVGPLLVVCCFFKYRCLDNIRYRVIPWYYWVLICQLIFMWIRFDVNGANGGTFRDMNGCGSTFLFLILMFPPEVFKLRYLQKWMLITSAVGVLYAIPNWNNLVLASIYIDNDGFYGDNSGIYINMAMAVGYAIMSCGLLLCIQHALSSKVKNTALIVTLLGVVILMVAGRRGFSALFLVFILVFFYSKIRYAPRGRKIVNMLYLFVFVMSFAYYVLSNADTQFSVLFNRLDTDSRSDVFYWWNQEMGADLFKWIFGKGVSGGYYDGDFGFIRPGIENGLRNMILKGGLLYLVPYILLGVRAFRLGFFCSNSRFMKMLSIYVCICISFLYVWGTPSFSFLHLNMWIAYTWIFSSKLRKMNDAELYRTIY